MHQSEKEQTPAVIVDQHPKNMNNKEIWIKKGYEIFANFGKNGLKIEPLAKSVGKSKSSFYHHFADLELFYGFPVELSHSTIANHSE